jgi:hypothetical protein
MDVALVSRLERAVERLEKYTVHEKRWVQQFLSV